LMHNITVNLLNRKRFFSAMKRTFLRKENY
jgi:hypothetical protein